MARTRRRQPPAPAPRRGQSVLRLPALLVALLAACGNDEPAEPPPLLTRYVATDADAVIRIASFDQVERDFGWLLFTTMQQVPHHALDDWFDISRKEIDGSKPLLFVRRPQGWYGVAPGVAPPVYAGPPPPIAQDLPDAYAAGRYAPWNVTFHANRDGPMLHIEADFGVTVEANPVADLLGCLPRDFPLVLAFGHDVRDILEWGKRFVLDEDLPAFDTLHEQVGQGVVTAFEFGEHGLTFVQVVHLRDPAGLFDAYDRLLRTVFANNPDLTLRAPLEYEALGAKVREYRADVSFGRLERDGSAHVFEAEDADAAGEAAAILGRRLDALGLYPHVSAFGKEVVLDSVRDIELVQKVAALPGGFHLGVIEAPGSATFERYWPQKPAAPEPLRWVKVADEARLRIGASRHRRGWMLCRVLPARVERIHGAPDFNRHLDRDPPSIILLLDDASQAAVTAQAGRRLALIVGGEAQHETKIDEKTGLLFKGGLTAEQSLLLRAQIAAPPLAYPLTYRGQGPGSAVRRIDAHTERTVKRLFGPEGLRVRIAVKGDRAATVLGGAPRLLIEVIGRLKGGRPPPKLAKSHAACGGNPELLLHVDPEAVARQLHRLAGFGGGPLPPFHRARASEPARLWTEGGRVGLSLDLAFLREAAELVQRDITLATCRSSSSDVFNWMQEHGRLPKSFHEIEQDSRTPNPYKSHQDEWGRDLWIEDLGGGKYRVGSSGPDGARGTADDIGEPWIDPPLGDVPDDAGKRWLAKRERALRSADTDAYVALLTWQAYTQRLGELEMQIEYADRDPELGRRLRALGGENYRDVGALWLATLKREPPALTFKNQYVKGNRLIVTATNGATFELIRDQGELRLGPP